LAQHSWYGKQQSNGLQKETGESLVSVFRLSDEIQTDEIQTAKRRRLKKTAIIAYVR
jgi:hypothetical protein